MARWLYEGPIAAPMGRPSAGHPESRPTEIDCRLSRRSGWRATRHGVGVGIVACFAVLAASAANAQQLTWVGCRGDLTRDGMEALAEAHGRLHGVPIAIQSGGATGSIRAVAAGAADLGCSGRRKMRADAERNAKLVPIGWDALVAVVHPSNPVKNISVADLAGIYAGNITNWLGLGGPDAEIELLVRGEEAASVGVILRELLFQNPDHAFAGTVLGEEDARFIEARVQANPQALAIISIGTASTERLSMLSVDGAAPHYSQIAAGKYPLIRPLYLVVSKRASKEVQQFTEFVKSPEGQQLVKFAGAVTLTDGAKLWMHFRKAVAKPRDG